MLALVLQHRSFAIQTILRKMRLLCRRVWGDDMRKFLTLIVGTAMGVASAANAADCGEPPLDMPTVPAGASADAAQIREARTSVLAYSATVDEFIACMERRTAMVSPYMTKEQIERRQADLNDLHNERRDLQIKLNEAIRAYRRATQNS